MYSRPLNIPQCNKTIGTNGAGDIIFKIFHYPFQMCLFVVFVQLPPEKAKQTARETTD
jgi:hypothetical protein